MKYQVTTSQGNTYTVDSVVEAKVKISTEAGGEHAASYKAIPATPK